MSGLLDAHGRPLSTANFKKDKPIALGPAFGDWAGRDATYNQMPGGSVLQFNLEHLTMQDYRAMRYHPQINSSLSVLTFMIHQCDWHLESTDKKMAQELEDDLRPLWTRLVRALSQSFWAGYSPIAMEFENDVLNRRVIISKFKDLIPEECSVHWKEVDSGYTPPRNQNNPTGEGFENLASAPGYGANTQKFKIFDGIDQIGLPYPIPPDASLWYPLLMENGNYYGRKLLKAAFTPWYFSTLVHLFANRYYERFGEPVPVGRAPFDDDFVQADGSTISGKQKMEEILMNLRNRSVVVLPNDIIQGSRIAGDKTAFEYSIDYLESSMRGADFERYLTRLDEEMSLALFTPLLLLRSGDVGSHNLGVQHTQCVSPDTKILCADLVWRKAGELQPGQEIVSFDEEAALGQGRGANARYYRTGFIVKNIPSSKPSMRISTDIGDSVTASVDHPWLVWRNRNMRDHGMRTKGLVWVETQDLVVGDQIAHLARPWQEDDTKEAGWLSGMFDGEGSMTRHQNTRISETTGEAITSNGLELTISQVEGPVFERLKATMGDMGFQFSVSQRNSDNTALGSKQQGIIRLGGGFKQALEFLGRIRPTRFLQNPGPVLWEDWGVRRNQTYELATVTEIEDVGVHPVASIETSTGTFITGGYLTHNSWLWMLNALVSDMGEYITRYVVQRLKAYNYSRRAPWVEWKPRPMGKDNVETFRAVIQTLVSSGKVKPDLEELGQAMGMTLTEVKQVTAPNDDGANGDTGDEKSEASDGPRGVGEPRATGREISARVRTQVVKAFRQNNFGSEFKPDLGYHKRFIQSLMTEGFAGDKAESIANEFYSRVERWVEDAASIGQENYSGASDFMSLFDRLVDNEIDSLCR